MKEKRKCRKQAHDVIYPSRFILVFQWPRSTPKDMDVLLWQQDFVVEVITEYPQFMV